MKAIKLLGERLFEHTFVEGKDKDVNILSNDSHQWIASIRLTNQTILNKHRATEPISVLCLGGKGVFKAGEELEDSQPLESGTLITLDANVLHEVYAEPELHVLVTKFKQI